MPRTPHLKDPSLLIELSSGQSHTIIPGDTLTGFVVLSPLWNARPFSHVQLTLYGRTKAKISRKNSKTTSIYRGRRLLFNIVQILYEEKDGGDGCQVNQSREAGEHAWPFEVHVPMCPSTGEKFGDEYEPKKGFLATGPTEEDMSTHTLPATYYFHASPGLSMTRVEAFVEYILSVSVSFLSTSHPQTTVALPLTLRAPSSEKPVTGTDLKMKSRSLPIVIKTLRLAPEHAIQPPGKRKQMKGFFGLEKVPKYAFTLKVGYPTVVQLESPEALALRIEVIPDLEETTMDITNGHGLPDVRVTGIEMWLHGTTTVRAPTTFSMTESEKSHEYRFKFEKPFGGNEFIIPTNQVLDLTPLLKLRLSRTHSSAQGVSYPKFERPLTPSFSTYNINVKYEIRWEIKIECAGVKESISNLFGFEWDECTVLGPSDMDAKAQESAWMGKERGRDYDEIGNAFSLGSQVFQDVLGLLGG